MALDPHNSDVYHGIEHIINRRTPLERKNPSEELRAYELTLELIACARRDGSEARREQIGSS
jgi:hypothetical protein